MGSSPRVSFGAPRVRASTLGSDVGDAIEPADDRVESSTRRRWELVGILVVALLPLIVLAIRVLLDGQGSPSGDQALIALRVGDVGGSHTPLVGSYQRFGWNQPGPLLFYVLAIPFRLFGSDYSALQLGALILNGFAVVLVALIAYARGGFVIALWVMTGVSVLMLALGPNVLSDPWEPSLSVLLLTALIFVSFDVALGRAWSLVALAGLATLLVQAHAALIGVTTALFVWGVAAFAVRWYRGRRASADASAEAPRWKAPVAATSVLLLVAWFPPVLQELRDRRGNIAAMWQFSHESHQTLGLVDGYRAVALQLGIRPPWAGFATPYVGFQPIVNAAAAQVIPIALVLLIAGVIFAAMRRESSVLLGLTVLVAIAIESLTLSRLVGELFSFDTQATWALGACAWIAAGWCFIASVRSEARIRLDRVLGVVLMLAIVVLTVLNTRAMWDGPSKRSRADVAVTEVSERAVPFARSVDGPVLVESKIPPGFTPYGAVGPELLALTMEQAGVPVVVGANAGNRFGAFRAQPGKARAELRLALADQAPTTPGWRTVARLDPLSAGERAERDRLGRRLERVLGPISSPEERLRAIAAHPTMRRASDRYSELSRLRPIVVAARSAPANDGSQ